MRKTHLQQSGFTLVELMVAIAILAILAAIAYPNYQTYIQRARMEAARVEMVSVIKAMERLYSKKMNVCKTQAADGTCSAMYIPYKDPELDLPTGLLDGRPYDEQPDEIKAIKTKHYNLNILPNPHSNNGSNYVIVSEPNNEANYSAELLGSKELIWVYYSDTATFAKCTSSGKSDSLSKKTNSTSSGEVSICLTS